MDDRELAAKLEGIARVEKKIDYLIIELFPDKFKDQEDEEETEPKTKKQRGRPKKEEKPQELEQVTVHKDTDNLENTEDDRLKISN